MTFLDGLLIGGGFLLLWFGVYVPWETKRYYKRLREMELRGFADRLK